MLMHKTLEQRVMEHSRYDIRWIGRCQYGTSDKIWGYFVYKDPTNPSARSNDIYAFWAPTGKSLHFAKHQHGLYKASRLVKQKKDRKYNEINEAELVSVYPNFWEDLDNKFIFFMLVGD